MKFENVSCSQCGRSFGPGDKGFSSCADHRKAHGVKHIGNPKGAGRKPVADPRIPLPYRMKTSVVEKAKRLGRDRVESIIKRAKETLGPIS